MKVATKYFGEINYEREDVLQFAHRHGVKALRFTHHGREILNRRDEMEQLVSAFAAEHGMDIRICFDGMEESLPAKETLR